MSSADIPFNNAVVLVAEGSEDKLFLDKQTASKLKEGEKTVIKFTNGMFLGYCKESHYNGRRKVINYSLHYNRPQ